MTLVVNDPLVGAAATSGSFSTTVMVNDPLALLLWAVRVGACVLLPCLAAHDVDR